MIRKIFLFICFALPSLISCKNFLIDRDGHPVCVGNPVASDTMWKLFNEALTNLD